MAEKDIMEKALESYDDVFADILNNLMFQGRRFVKEEELEQGRERSFYTGEKKIREQERDTSKYWKHNNIRIAYVGIENETEPEDVMPFRVIGYDGAAYRDQIRTVVKADGTTVREMSRYPVITLVLYFGYKKHWNTAKSIHEVLGDKLDERLKPFVSDYRIHVFEIAYLTDEQLAGFKSDFRFVADYFVQKQRTGTYVGSHEQVRHVREVLQLLAVLENDNRHLAAARAIQEGKEPRTMSEVIDQYMEKGRVQGLAQGMEQGLEQGREQGRTLAEENLMKLVHALFEAGRIDDIRRASVDPEYLAELYEEFGISFTDFDMDE